MRTMATIGAVLALVLVAPAGAGSVPVDEGHVHWVHPDDAWFTHAGTVDANGDEVPDVVVAAGDRSSPYAHCAAPPGSPFPPLHSAKDMVLAPTAKLLALDGTNGEPLWEVVWGEGGLVGVRPERDRAELLTGMHTDDLDGDGEDDLLVLRSSFPQDGSEVTHRVTMYDPTDGSVEWELTRTSPGDAIVLQGFIPTDVFGSPGGLYAYVETIIEIGGGGISIDFEVESHLARLEPGAPPVTVAQLPDDLGFPMPVPYEDGLRLLSLEPRIEVGGPGNAALTVDARAVDVSLDPQGDAAFAPAWSRPGGGGAQAALLGGADPALVVGRGDGESPGTVAAIDLDDGRDRWEVPVNVGAQGGTFLPADVNGDGDEDVIASPAFGTDETGLLTGGLFAELVALDGRDGSELWRHMDRAAKFRAWSLTTADVDGDATDEVVAALTPQDGFPLCAQTADDAGAVGVYDLTTGATRCRLPTERVPLTPTAAELNEGSGDEVVAATLGGNVWSFTDEEPGCGLLGTDPPVT